MPLKTGRFYDSAEVKINRSRCTACGMCVKVCKGAPLYMKDHNVMIDQGRIFGCIGCGQCMAVCPKDAIEVNGRDMSPSDVLDPVPAESTASYEQLKALMLSRRSIRNFSERAVDRSVTEQILAASATAPNGLGATDVEVLVIDSKEKIALFLHDLINSVKQTRKVFTPATLKLSRPFIGKDKYEFYKTFFLNATEAFIDGYEKDHKDWLLWSAPLIMYFHSSPTADPADTSIAATYAVLAAESLGLGSCMLGTPAIFLNSGGKKLKEKYGIPAKNKNGIMVVFGYPAIQYHHALKRRFAGVKYL